MKVIITVADIALLGVAVTQLVREMKASFVPAADPGDLLPATDDAIETTGINVGNVSKIVLWAVVISAALLTLSSTI